MSWRVERVVDFIEKKNCREIYSRVVELAIAPLLERLKKVLASIDCCKYAALQHAISFRVERGLRRMDQTYCRLDK